MNKTELIATVAESAGITKKDAERVLNAAFDARLRRRAAGRTRPRRQGKAVAFEAPDPAGHRGL